MIDHTKAGSLCYTDEWQAYTRLRIRGNYVVIAKEKGKPKGRDHPNGIEGFWSYQNERRNSPITALELYFSGIHHYI